MQGSQCNRARNIEAAKRTMTGRGSASQVITSTSSRQIGEQGRRHLRRELLEEPAWFRDVPLPEMDE
jgi:hypothetical protein